MSREIITMVENGEVTVSEALSLLRKVGMGSDQPKQEPARNERIAAIKQQLDSLIGLHSVKELINEIQAFVEIQQRRAAFNLARIRLSFTRFSWAILARENNCGENYRTAVPGNGSTAERPSG